jgi:hypothetical protein
LADRERGEEGGSRSACRWYGRSPAKAACIHPVLGCRTYDAVAALSTAWLEPNEGLARRRNGQPSRTVARYLLVDDRTGRILGELASARQATGLLARLER